MEKNKNIEFRICNQMKILGGKIQTRERRKIVLVISHKLKLFLMPRIV